MVLKQQGKVQTIMLIEDEDDILLVYRDFLERKGYKIEVSAPTANEILRDYDAYRPDLVILDYKLPGNLNGLQAAEKILRKHNLARILIVTAFEDAKKEFAKNEFFNDKKVSVLTKPVHLGELARIVTNF
jgi:DNA-binding response OmpR family regulator